MIWNAWFSELILLNDHIKHCYEQDLFASTNQIRLTVIFAVHPKSNLFNTLKMDLNHIQPGNCLKIIKLKWTLLRVFFFFMEYCSTCYILLFLLLFICPPVTCSISKPQQSNQLSYDTLSPTLHFSSLKSSLTWIYITIAQKRWSQCPFHADFKGEVVNFCTTKWNSRKKKKDCFLTDSLLKRF